MCVFEMLPDVSNTSITEPAKFLICEDLAGVTKDLMNNNDFTHIAQSSIESNVRLLKRSEASLITVELVRNDLEKIPEEAQLNLVMNMLYRYAFRINDSCFRNLLWNSKDNRVFSVDEANIFAPNLPSHLF